MRIHLEKTGNIEIASLYCGVQASLSNADVAPNYWIKEQPGVAAIVNRIWRCRRAMYLFAYRGTRLLFGKIPVVPAPTSAFGRELVRRNTRGDLDIASPLEMIRIQISQRVESGAFAFRHHTRWIRQIQDRIAGSSKGTP